MRAFERRHLLFHQRGRGALAARLHAGEEIALEAVLVGNEAAQIVIGGVGLRYDVQQVEGAARGRRQVGRDGRNDAARRAGDEEAGIAVQDHAGFGGHGLLFEANRPAVPVRVSDLHGAGIAQRLPDEQIGDLRRGGSGAEIHGLHQRFRPFALVGFGEAGHAAAERVQCSGCIVSVAPTEARGGNQKRAGDGDAVIERPHGTVERFHAKIDRFAPAGQRHLLQIGFPVECRQPEDAIDCARRIGAAGHFHAQPAQLFGQRFTRAAAVGHNQHALAGSECDAGWLAEFERGPQGRHGDAPRNAGGGFERGRLRRGAFHFRRRRSGGRALAGKADHVPQRREIAQLERLVARDAERSADCREHFRLLHGVHAEVGFHVEIRVEHFFRIPGLLHHDGENLVANGIRSRRCAGSGAEPEGAPPASWERSPWEGAGAPGWLLTTSALGAAGLRSGRRSCTN